MQSSADAECAEMLRAPARIEPSGIGPGTDPTRRWVLAGVALALVFVIAAIAKDGAGATGLRLGLRLTARLAFLAFWPSYSAGALVVLFGSGYAPLKTRARALGLTFVAVLVVHLSLVAALCGIGEPPAARVFIIFGPGAVCAMLMASASVRSVSEAIGAPGWWLLRNVGMNYIAFDFLVDFLRRDDLTSVRRLVEYVPFAALAVAGPALRLAAYLKRRGVPIFHRT